MKSLASALSLILFAGATVSTIWAQGDRGTITGLVTEGMPTISLRNWGFILWLAGINTALAFTLWNHTLRTLTATESSICTGTMLVWIPILAVVFLGEQVTVKQVIALVAVGAGTLLVQLRGQKSAAPGPTDRRQEGGVL